MSHTVFSLTREEQFVHGDEGHFFLPILILLASAAVVSTIFYRLKIPALLAFLLVGLVLGPTGIGVITDVEELRAIAELGLVFLLFVLGLEFSLPRLIAMRHSVFRLGSAQVSICTLVFFVAFYWWGLDWKIALVVAGGLALSSTAIVSRELLQQGHLHKRHGQIAIGVLLFQDLVAVGLLISVPLIAGGKSGVEGFALAFAVGKSAALLVAFFLFGRFLLPRLLAEVARTRSDELLVFSALVIVLMAGVTTEAVGLSMELGAFLAGMMLGETRFKHQLEVDVRPFRDVLLGLFFISIGMLIDIAMLQEYWLRIIVSGLALLVFKGAIIATVARVLGEPLRAALPAGLALAQGGEFLFALLALATRDNLIQADVASFLLSVTIVSMALTPVLIRHSQTLVDVTEKFLSHKNASEVISVPTADSVPHHEGHVIILGFGRVGQTIGRFLRQLNIPYIALDTDVVRIAEAVAAEEPVYYGDTTRADILKVAGVGNASLLVISFNDADHAKHIMHLVKQLNPELPVFIRTRDDANLGELIQAGAREVIPETLEASLTLVSHVLVMLKVPNQKIHDVIQAARGNRYKMLHGFYHGEHIRPTDSGDTLREILHAVRLVDGAWACGKTLQELGILPHATNIIDVHRNGEVIQDEDFKDALASDDIITLLGNIEQVSMAEVYLLTGRR